MSGQNAGIQLPELSPNEVIVLAEEMYQSGDAKDQPLILYGSPGIGKTGLVKKLSEKLFGDGKAIIISAPLLEPTDVKGLPVPDLEKKLAYWLEPYFLPKSGPGLILIDDITASTRSVIASLLMLVQQRQVLTYKLPDDVMIIAAGNRIEDMSYCDRLSAAMRSRLMQITVVPNVEEWIDWAYKNNIHESVVAFIKFKRERLCSTAKEMNDMAFPCPRTWEHVSNTMKRNLPDKIRRAAVMGSVGVAAGNEFLMYQELYTKLPTVEEILANPATAKVPKAADALHAVTSAVAMQAKHSKHHKAIIEYTKRLPEDFQVTLLMDAFSVSPDIAFSGETLPDGTIKVGQYIKEFTQKYGKLARFIER